MTLNIKLGKPANRPERTAAGRNAAGRNAEGRNAEGTKKLRGFDGTTGTGAAGIRTRNAAPFNRLNVKAPTVRFVTPCNDFMVDGVVFILIDAAADLDPVGDLKVDIRINGIISMRATYSTSSGYYGAIWDSSTAKTGAMHTITAKVTDSAGNTKSTHTVVSIG
jgi:hypothetical protein